MVRDEHDTITLTAALPRQLTAAGCHAIAGVTGGHVTIVVDEQASPEQQAAAVAHIVRQLQRLP